MNKKWLVISIFLAVIIVLIIPKDNSISQPAGFRIGPDGNAYKLVDCSIPENNTNPDLCFNTTNPVGRISWNSARSRAIKMNYGGFSCDLASPSTKEVNNFLKSFPGFLDACQDDCNFGGLPPFELCAIFGGVNNSGSGTDGPYQFLNCPGDDIPCPHDECDPIIEPGVDTELAFEDWCRVENGCGATEPNNAGDDYMGYVYWPTANNNEGIIGWSDCSDACDLSQNNQCQPTSYFVQCNLVAKHPAPTLSQWGFMAFVLISGLIAVLFIRKRKAENQI